jgi:hypothetical protein
VNVPQGYVAQATFVANFDQDSGIRYRVAEIESAFRSVCVAQAVSTNVPDSAPGAIPRFTIQSGPKTVSVSQVSAQLDLDFSEQRKSLKNTFDIIEKNVSAFWSGMLSLKRVSEVRHGGLVLTVNFPSQLSREEICATILDRYAKVPTRGQPATAAIQFGYLDTELHLFNNVSLAQYEIRQGLVQGPVGARQLEIDVSSIPVREQGFETKVDINSRPMTTANLSTPSDLGEILLRNMKACLFDWGTEFFSW